MKKVPYKIRLIIPTILTFMLFPFTLFVNHACLFFDITIGVNDKQNMTLIKNSYEIEGVGKIPNWLVVCIGGFIDLFIFFLYG